MGTTVSFHDLDGRADTFIITGDIEAMWLRDSTAQIWCYLPLAADDTRVRRIIGGVINRQTDCILIDPYANAFNREPSGGQWQGDHTRMHPQVYERKWEIDSLCYPIRLAHGYWRTTGDASLFDDRWLTAMRTVVRTFREQQRKGGEHGPYRFQRTTPEAMDTLPIRGFGNPTAPVGLICSAFRPSDDATIFPFLIPSNLFAMTSMRQLAAILAALHVAPDLAEDGRQLAAEIERAVASPRHPRASTPCGPIYAYEVDGYGGRVSSWTTPTCPACLPYPTSGAAPPTIPSTWRRGASC